MTLFLRDTGAAPDWLDEWPLGVRPAFIESRAYDVLKRDLGRYLRREVNGRSFLISGHRGAGKTSMVVRAVDDARRDALRRSVAAPTTDDDAPQLPLQRPLLVKLHGPSLLSLDAAPKPVPPKPAPPKPGPKAADASEQTAKPKPDEAKPEEPSTPASRALVQITIALYRALAREAGDAYGIHARELERLRTGDENGPPLPGLRGGGDYAELAGQLVLDLDRAPGPATLRAFWSRLDRLNKGVLWPRNAVWRGREGSFNDQGIGEVLALSTASQAYQVCSGALVDSDNDTDTANDDETLTATAGLDLADLSNKLVGLAAGAGVTAALSTTGVTAPAIAAGVATGLVSAMALTWSHTRSLKRERKRTYSFIRDRTVQTLDRDLPLMIERVRAAGLAAVFVVDELDKLTDATAMIGEFIGRLKHLTTDFGFFCFLTDRDYYEYILRSLRNEAFPKEHTYFSERQFILYGPSEFKAYLDQLVDSTEVGKPGYADDNFDRKVFALLLLHRSKLNTVDVVRELARVCDAEGRLRPTPTRIGSDPGNQLQATVQLAIDHILRGNAVNARIEGEPIFAQLAIDALYRISREWEDETPEVILGDDAVIKCLADRIRRKKVATVDEAKKVVGEVIGEVDVRLLQQQAVRLEGYLKDFASLRADLTKEPPPEGLAILDLIPDPQIVGGLLQPAGKGKASFTFDAFGRDLREAKPPPTAKARAKAPVRVAPDHTSVVDAFAEMLTAANAPVDDLARFGLLPRTIVWSEVQDARALLAIATTPAADADKAKAVLAAFNAAVSSRGPMIYAVLAMACQVMAAAGKGPAEPLTAALAALARYRDLPAEARRPVSVARLDEWFTPSIAVDVSLPDGNVAARLKAWGKRLSALRAADKVATPATADLVTAAWDRWLPTVRTWPLPGPGTDPIAFDDLVLATLDRMPSSLMRPDLRGVSLLDWGKLALSALTPQEPDRQPPLWAGLAALRASGFGADILTRLAREASSLFGQPAEGAQELIGDLPPQSGPAALLIVGDTPGLAGEAPKLGQPPTLAVMESELEVYGRTIDWLVNLEALNAVVDGRI